MLLAKENVAWSGLSVIPINYFINTSELQNKHNKQTNNILRVMQDFCHIMHLVYGRFSLFRPCWNMICTL